ncbi:MAG: SRPBCC family protein [Geminicoccaceae bacterium]
MRPTSFFAGTVAAGVFSIGMAVSAASALELSESADVAASPSDAWAAIAEFCSIKDWHPVIAECEQFEQDGKTMRTLTTGDGGELLEELNNMDDTGMAMTYSIIESPLPISDYVSTIGVTESGDGATITWSSEFNAAGVSDEEALELMAGIYRAGLDALEGQLGQ